MICQCLSPIGNWKPSAGGLGVVRWAFGTRLGLGSALCRQPGDSCDMAIGSALWFMKYHELLYDRKGVRTRMMRRRRSTVLYHKCAWMKRTLLEALRIHFFTKMTGHVDFGLGSFYQVGITDCMSDGRQEKNMGPMRSLKSVNKLGQSVSPHLFFGVMSVFPAIFVLEKQAPVNSERPRPGLCYAAAERAAELRSEPDEAQCLELARWAIELMKAGTLWS